MSVDGDQRWPVYATLSPAQGRVELLLELLGDDPAGVGPPTVAGDANS